MSIIGPRPLLVRYLPLLAGFLVSVVIELSQLIFKRGLFEGDDMIHNALGCMLGCWVMNWIFVKLKNCK